MVGLPTPPKLESGQLFILDGYSGLLLLVRLKTLWLYGDFENRKVSRAQLTGLARPSTTLRPAHVLSH